MLAARERCRKTEDGIIGIAHGANLTRYPTQRRETRVTGAGGCAQNSAPGEIRTRSRESLPHRFGEDGDRNGNFTVKRRRSAAHEGEAAGNQTAISQRMYDPVAQTGEWLKSVVKWLLQLSRGPGKHRQPAVYRVRVIRLWRRTYSVEPEAPPHLDPHAIGWLTMGSQAATTSSLSRASFAASPSAIRAVCAKSASYGFRAVRSTGVPTATFTPDRGEVIAKRRASLRGGV